MNIPKVTHTPRVEAVYGQNETWKIEGVSVCDMNDGRLWCRFSDAHAGVLFKADASSFLACLAAALGREVVQREEKPAPAPAPARPEYVKVTDLRGDETQPLTVGKVYKVEGWGAGSPIVMNDKGGSWYLSNGGEGPDSCGATLASWVPADAPAPCEPTEKEYVAALHGYATCHEGHGERIMAALKAVWAVKA